MCLLSTPNDFQFGVLREVLSVRTSVPLTRVPSLESLSFCWFTLSDFNAMIFDEKFCFVRACVHACVYVCMCITQMFITVCDV